jgi:hypothetical protein
MRDTASPSLVIKLFFRVALFILIYSGIIYYNSLYIISLDTEIVIYAGLYQSSSIIYSFVLVLVLIVIIFLIVYYPDVKKKSMGAMGKKIYSFFLTNYTVPHSFNIFIRILISYIWIGHRFCFPLRYSSNKKLY